MHFEILVEDRSGEIALDILVPQIITAEHTYKIHFYKGIGHLPKTLNAKTDPQKRILLDQLPRLIQGYGRTFSDIESYDVILIIVCDLDNRCLSAFRRELLSMLAKCETKPETYFCIAVEEGEAWLLGDLSAVVAAYPHAKSSVLNSYENDSICGTWEKLADALFPGGVQKLSKLGHHAVGQEKASWAELITPHMNIDNNLSPSFCYFRDKLRRLIVMNKK